MDRLQHGICRAACARCRAVKAEPVFCRGLVRVSHLNPEDRVFRLNRVPVS